jgi:hypothetical protein
VSRRRVILIAAGVAALLLSGALGLAAARWSQRRAGGSADAVYEQARRQLAAGDFDRAAASFHRVWAERRDTSAEVADAPYWEAFARYRSGSPQAMMAAVDALRQQARAYPRAPTRPDARALEQRILAILDQAAAEGSPGARMPVVTADTLCGGSGGEAGLAGVGPLLHLGSDDAGALLRQVIARRADCPAPVRREAVMLLAQAPSEGDGAVLADAARHDPDPGVRREATFWLSAVPTPAVAGMLDSLARSPAAGESREGAVEGLARLHTPDSRRRLRALLLDPAVPGEVKQHALIAIGGFHDEAEGGALLRELYPSLPADLKPTCIQMVGQSRSEQNARWLLARALDPAATPEIAAEAIYWAGHTGIPARELIALYPRFREQEPRVRILHALSEDSDPAAAAFVARVAASDPALEMRMVAREFTRRHR